MQQKELNFSDSAQLKFNNDDRGQKLVVKANKRVTSLIVESGSFETPSWVDDNTVDILFTTAPVDMSGTLQVTLAGWPPVEIGITFE